MKNIFITNIEKYKIWMSKKKSKDCLQETKKIIYVNNGENVKNTLMKSSSSSPCVCPGRNPTRSHP